MICKGVRVGVGVDVAAGAVLELDADLGMLEIGQLGRASLRGVIGQAGLVRAVRIHHVDLNVAVTV